MRKYSFAFHSLYVASNTDDYVRAGPAPLKLRTGKREQGHWHARIHKRPCGFRKRCASRHNIVYKVNMGIAQNEVVCGKSTGDVCKSLGTRELCLRRRVACAQERFCFHMRKCSVLKFMRQCTQYRFNVIESTFMHAILMEWHRNEKNAS